MELIIDIGNTQSKLGVFAGGRLLEVLYHSSFDLAAIECLLKTHEFSSAIFCSVRRGDEEFLDLLQKNLRLLVFDHSTPVPVKNRYGTPETLGKDRLAGVIGAQSLFPDKDILVIDAGTCVTYDFINKEGEYFGGSISPGLDMRFKALHNYTGRLPLIGKREAGFLTGKSTEESILTGVQIGLEEEMKGFISRYREQCPGLMPVLCGGDSKYFENKLKNNIFAFPELVLLGLHKILKYNAL